MKQVFTNIAIAVIALLGVSNSFAQGQPPNRIGLPNNSWGLAQNVATLDTRTLIATACSTAQSVGWSHNYCPSGYYPNAGIPTFLTSYTTCGSGYHGHDANCNTARPQATKSPSGFQYSDQNGDTSWTVSLPGYAGYYTFEATFTFMQGPGVKGINYYGADYDDWATNEDGLPTMSTGPLVNYILDPNVNFPSPYLDFGHSTKIYYMDVEVSQALELASVKYATRSLALLGYFDHIMLVRASLPDGGINDDYSVVLNGGTSAWNGTTPMYMESADGAELDIKNPVLSPTGQAPPGISGISPQLIDLSMSQYKCYLSAYPASFIQQPTFTNYVQRQSYWFSQPMMHYACGVQPLHRPVTIH